MKSSAMESLSIDRLASSCASPTIGHGGSRMKTAGIFAEGVGAGFGFALLVSLLLLLAVRGSRVRVRRSALLQDPAPPANYLDLCRAAGL